MIKNISTSFNGIIIICNLFNKMNRNTASRVISLFKMPIGEIINFVMLFYSMIVLRILVFRNLQVWPTYCKPQSFSSQDKT